MSSELAPNDHHSASEENDLHEIIKWFLNQYQYLHEYRLQKIIYLVELLAVEEEKDRITDIDYKPYMYGSYSEDLSEAISDLEGKITRKPDMHHGKSISVYSYSGDAKLDEDVVNLLQDVHDLSQSKSNEELAEWSKESWLYENTGFGEPMNFDRYLQRLQTEEMTSDVDKLRPN